MRHFLLLLTGILSLITFFGCLGTLPALTNDSLRISGEAAMRHVEKMVGWGPHPPGSEAQRKVGDYLIEQLESYGLTVYNDEFEPVTPLGRLSMRNIWGEIPGELDSVIILASHYDSKYYEEFEFVGANDSGSSSGVVLELARALGGGENPTPFTLWFVFFDGEEALVEWTSTDSLYGSRRFVRLFERRGELNRVAAMILLDMVGSKDLQLFRESHSTAWINDVIWETAAGMGHEDIFRPQGKVSALDDHIPFLEAEIPAVDLIDMNYRYWHTVEDTPDKLSPRKMEIVGNVVLAALPRVAARLLDMRGDGSLAPQWNKERAAR